MPIRPRTLERHGEKQIVLMDGTKTLYEALQSLAERSFRENRAYLVVARADGGYQVALFSELKRVVANLGYDSFTLPLEALPIPFADRIVPTDTPQGGREIVEWVAIMPQSTVVVVEGDQVVGLFANPNRGEAAGYLERVSLLELSGPGAKLHRDKRASFEARVELPVCPHCGGRHHFRFDPLERVYTCPACGKVVDLL